MRSVLVAEFVIALMLVMGVVATRRRSFLSLHVWAVSVSAAMLLGFLYWRVNQYDEGEIKYLIVAMTIKNISLCLLLRKSALMKEETSDAGLGNKRLVIAALGHLRDHDRGLAAGLVDPSEEGRSIHAVAAPGPQSHEW